MANLLSLDVDSTGFVKLPTGTTAQRPGSPQDGYTRYNTDNDVVEFYSAGGWYRADETITSTSTGDVYSYEIYDNGTTYQVHVFFGNGTFSPEYSGNAEYLIVAGGGGGGSMSAACAGGGGAGGFLTGITNITNNTDYSVIVGNGGAKGAVGDFQGSNGGNSSVFGITATGGGGGGGGQARSNGVSGGSGGGGGESEGAAGTGIESQGFNGTPGSEGGNFSGAGGGAGSTANGLNAGKGLPSSITGTTIFYAGGGAGGNFASNTFGTPGVGGGGSSEGGQGQDGVANAGGGGGGTTTNTSGQGGNGGSGIVVVRHPVVSTKIYRPEVVTEGLVVHLDAGNTASFNINEHTNSSRPWRDLSQEGNDAQIRNGDGKTYVTGKHNGSVIFDGVSTIAEIPDNSSIDFTEQFSYELWLKVDAFSGNNTGNNQTPIAKARQNYRIFINTSQQPIFRLQGFNDLQTNTAMTAGEWYHLVAVRDTNGSAWYVNGVLDISNSQTGTMTPNSSSLTIGGWSTSSLSRQSDGEIAVVRVYNRRLGEKEIQNNFEATRGRFGI